ncbi:MAG: response regulator [Candidatus Neomarinimicrobiota bacterium]
MEKAQNKLVNDTLNRPMILVLEDDDSSQQLMSIHLMDQYDSCYAVSFEEAMNLLKKERSIDLALVDLALIGDKDGLDFVRYLRKSKKWRNLPVIAVTAHVFRINKQQSIAAGCDDFLTKPIRRQELLNAIEKYFPNQ